MLELVNIDTNSFISRMNQFGIAARSSIRIDHSLCFSFHDAYSNINISI